MAALYFTAFPSGSSKPLSQVCIILPAVPIRAMIPYVVQVMDGKPPLAFVLAWNIIERIIILNELGAAITVAVAPVTAEAAT